jgi:hypothetical protein
MTVRNCLFLGNSDGVVFDFAGPYYIGVRGCSFDFANFFAYFLIFRSEIWRLENQLVTSSCCSSLYLLLLPRCRAFARQCYQNFRLNPRKAKNVKWDAACAVGCACYEKRMHNLWCDSLFICANQRIALALIVFPRICSCDNCHSHVARCLNTMEVTYIALGRTYCHSVLLF